MGALTSSSFGLRIWGLDDCYVGIKENTPIIHGVFHVKEERTMRTAWKLRLWSALQSFRFQKLGSLFARCPKSGFPYMRLYIGVPPINGSYLFLTTTQVFRRWGESGRWSI